MNIVIVHNSKIPAIYYGGIERVIWYLGMELSKLGHKITYLAAPGSHCPFANILPLNPEVSIQKQVPRNTDFVHFHFNPGEEIQFPYLVTIHGNLPEDTEFFQNTNFVSENHAMHYGVNAFVYNGFNWDEYGKPEITNKMNYVHFLGKAAWRVKNVNGAIKIAHSNKTEIKILGGTRVNFKMGLRVSLSKWAKFYGMVATAQKIELLRHSKALIFPVLWHEPFGLAIIESLYFGCPVLGTKYGSLPELIPEEFGFLSNSIPELIENFERINSFDPLKCNEYAVEKFNSKIMALNYTELYERILNGYNINENVPAFVNKE
jgi:glycosyltransferase involved in cell wall biosynthesis